MIIRANYFFFIVPFNMNKTSFLHPEKSFSLPSLIPAIFHQVLLVQTLESTIHRINHYPVDKYWGNQLHYPLARDLSGGQRYPPFDQLRPELCALLPGNSKSLSWKGGGHFLGSGNPDPQKNFYLNEGCNSLLC